jgi:uncharacterized protein YkwD
VRNTPKRLAATLSTLLIALLAAPTAPAPAHPLRGHGARRHHTKTHRHARHKHIKTSLRTHTKKPRRTPTEASTAAVIAGVLGTPCANTELTPSETNLPLIRAAVQCLINRERAEHGELPLQTNADLQRAAESHASELITVDYFAHVAPDGETPVERIEGTGYIPSPYDGYVIGENLAWGTYSLSTPAAIVAAWIASPGHLANILETQYTETGIAITPAVPQSLGDGAPGATYAQEFGVIIH